MNLPFSLKNPKLFEQLHFFVFFANDLQQAHALKLILWIHRTVQGVLIAAQTPMGHY